MLTYDQPKNNPMEPDKQLTDPDQQLAIDLYVRAEGPIAERRDTVIERLEQFDRRNQISEFSIHPWPRAMSLTLVKKMDDNEIAGVFQSSEEWADQHGLHIQPPFDVRTSRSAITGETDELLVLPVICLAAYSDGDLIAVFPCSDEESVYTVADALDAIAAGKSPTSASSIESDSASSDSERRKRSETENPSTDMTIPNLTGTTE